MKNIRTAGLRWDGLIEFQQILYRYETEETSVPFSISQYTLFSNAIYKVCVGHLKCDNTCWALYDYNTCRGGRGGLAVFFTRLIIASCVLHAQRWNFQAAFVIHWTQHWYAQSACTSVSTCATNKKAQLKTGQASSWVESLGRSLAACSFSRDNEESGK